MSGVHAFVDECGNTSLDTEKQGVSKFFVVTAVFFRTGTLTEVRAAAEAIRQEFFQKGEMKSKSIGPNDSRRKRVLEAISTLSITTYSLAIDKSRIDATTGLRHKRSFVKYVNRRLYERAFRIHEGLSLVADEHGSEQFMKGFVDYVDERIPRTLFSRASFSFSNSRDEVLLQVADMVAGTLARALEPAKRSDAANEFIALIAKREAGYDIWPPLAVSPAEAFLDGLGVAPNDESVRRHCLRQAALFLQQNADSNSEDRRLQVAVLELLTENLQFGREKKYLATGRIIGQLTTQTGLQLTERKLRAAVSQLRDAGVIIANSSKGYKLPVNEADVAHFASHTNSIVPAMLARLSRARDDLRVASNGEVDILKTPAFDLLRRLVESLKRTEPHS